MYLLMSAFHLPPWLKLIAGRRRGSQVVHPLQMRRSGHVCPDLLLSDGQCPVCSEAAIHAITASEKPCTRVHASYPTPCWYEATFTM